MRVWVVVLLVFLSSGCTSVSQLPQITEPETPEDFCEQNTMNELKLHLEKSSIELHSPTILEIKQFENLDEAYAFTGGYSLIERDRLSGGLTVEPFYVAIGRLSSDSPKASADRFFYDYLCDLEGNLIDSPPTEETIDISNLIFPKENNIELSSGKESLIINIENKNRIPVKIYYFCNLPESIGDPFCWEEVEEDYEDNLGEGKIRFGVIEIPANSKEEINIIYYKSSIGEYQEKFKTWQYRNLPESALYEAGSGTYNDVIEIYYASGWIFNSPKLEKAGSISVSLNID